MSDKDLTVIEQKEVLLYDDTVIAVLVEKEGKREPYIPLRPICDNLGVAWQAQLRRVNRDPVLREAVGYVTVRVTHLGSMRGTEMVCLPLEFISGFLFGISATRVKPEIRERLIQYQKDCYRVLDEAFREGRLTARDHTFDELLATDSPSVQAYRMILAMERLARQQIMIEAKISDHEDRIERIEETLGNPERHVTPGQATAISQAVKAIALELGKRTGRNEFGGVYGELYRRFEITGYRALPAAKYEDAMNFLRQWYSSLTDGAALPF